jgi:SAM-dependent methyltransferase
VVEDEYGGVQARYYDQYFTGVQGDLEFYVGLALEVGSPVLELGCGTGRILTRTARAGISCVGIDRSLPMLQRARRSLAVDGIADRVRIVVADMRSFSLRGRFSLATIPYRTFQHLLTPADQYRALCSIHNHLEPGGLLAFNIFEPTGLLAAYGWKGEEAAKKDIEFTDPETGDQVEVWYTRSYDPLRQLMLQELSYRPAEGADRGGPVEQARLTLRYSYRYEIEHLLQLCGFKVKALYGDFAGGGFSGTGEQVWVAQKE